MKKLAISLIAAASLFSAMAFATSAQVIRFDNTKAGYNVYVSNHDNPMQTGKQLPNTNGFLNVSSPEFFITVETKPVAITYHCHVKQDDNYVTANHQAYVLIGSAGNLLQNNGGPLHHTQTPFNMSGTTLPYCSVAS